MSDPTFVELVGKLTEAFGQQMGSMRQVPEGILLATTDGFLYTFVEDPTLLSLAGAERWVAEAPGGPRRLVVFARQHLPPAISTELAHRHVTLVEGPRFGELCRSLGLGAYLGDEPRPEPASRTRLLPSAHLLDALMTRGRTWAEWGVPALALRFFRQAHDLKPGFLPARIGIANAFLRMGLVPEAETAFREIRRADPSNLDARIGEAAVQGALGHPDLEVRGLEALVREQPEDLALRTHLLAALLDHHHWEAARRELATMLERLPDDPRLRFLHAATFLKSGATKEGEAERDRARAIGLSIEDERQLSIHLGLPPPPLPKVSVPVPRLARAKPAVPAPTPAPGRSRRDTTKTARRASPKRAPRRIAHRPPAGRKHK
jgi:tetratricopeptide (TPR) repeat protein